MIIKNEILLALSLFCLPATAAEYWVAETKAGGQIVLTFDKTSNCGKDLYFMYLVNSQQDVNYGCWIPMNDAIHVRYDNGILQVYATSGWTRKYGL